MPQFTVTVEGPWARIVYPSGRTALAGVAVTPNRMVFDIVRWFDTQEELLAVMAAITYSGAARSTLMEVVNAQELTPGRSDSSQGP